MSANNSTSGDETNHPLIENGAAEQKQPRNGLIQRASILFKVFLLMLIAFILIWSLGGSKGIRQSHAPGQHTIDAPIAILASHPMYPQPASCSDLEQLSSIKHSVSFLEERLKPALAETFTSAKGSSQQADLDTLFVSAIVTIRGSSLSVAAEPFCIVDLPILEGTNGARLFIFASSYVIIDATGLAQGWYVNIKATDFHDADGNIIPAEAFQMSLKDEKAIAISGNQKPSTLISAPTALSTTFQRIIFAARGSGMGSYFLQPTFALMISPDVPDSLFSSTYTIALISGP